jgi:hypothetical protein
MVQKLSVNVEKLQGIRRSLGFTLHEKGMILRSELWRLCQEQYYDEGRKFSFSIQQDYEQLTGRSLIEDTLLPSYEFERLAAHGSALTRYLIAGVDLNMNRHVHKMGALINTIVTLYDMSLENGSILPLSGERAVRHAKAPPGVFTVAETPIECLLQLYWDGVKSLGVRNEHIYASLIKHFSTMFEEENLTVNADCEETTILRKSTLPSMVMVLPAFVDADSTILSYSRARFVLAYRVGELIGLVDDLVDLPEDLANGHPNIYLRRGFVSNTGDISETQVVIDEILNKVTRINRDWSSFVRGKRPQPLYITAAFSVALASWLGLYQ